MVAQAQAVLNSVGSAIDETLARTPGGIVAAGTAFTRPADTTAYAQYDLVAALTSGAAAVEIPSIVPAGEALRWEGCALRSANASAKGKTFRVHLFSSAPTLTVNDNGAFNPTGAQVLAVSSIAGYLGYCDVTLTEAGAAGAAGRGFLTNPLNVAPAATSLWWVLEQRDAAGYTPLSAEQFAMTVLGLRA